MIPELVDLIALVTGRSPQLPQARPPTSVVGPAGSEEGYLGEARRTSGVLLAIQ